MGHSQQRALIVGFRSWRLGRSLALLIGEIWISSPGHFFSSDGALPS
jgi:hypothetical protein